MPDRNNLKLLFIINPGSGKNNNIDYVEVINEYFSKRTYQPEFFELSKNLSPDSLKQKIKEADPAVVIAIGGDGTLKLVAQCLMKTDIPLGIIPAGSANGLAKELGIDTDPEKALDVIEKKVIKTISLVKINDELCIHLSDIGFNAFVIRKFETEEKRGMWGYIKAAWKVLWNYSTMEINIMIDGEEIRRDAAMVVVANATKYGTGVLINPAGDLTDNLFEVIIVKKVSFSEIFKMRFTHKPYDPAKTELFQTQSLKIRSKRKVHFQVDGEYMGRVNMIEASLLPGVLKVIVPE